MASIEPGQFDDASEDVEQVVSRPLENAYIDISGDSSTDDDDEDAVYSDEFDDFLDCRVEDEDWEISEKGAASSR